MSQQRPLALTFPLHGSRLIEASAGTGLDQTAAMQGKRQGQRALLIHAASSSSARGLLSSSDW